MVRTGFHRIAVSACGRHLPCCFFLVLTPDGVRQREFFYVRSAQLSQRQPAYTTKPQTIAPSVCRVHHAASPVASTPGK